MTDDGTQRLAGPPEWRGHLSQDDLSVETFGVVGPDGSYDAEEVPDLTAEEYRDLYRWMALQRTIDHRMVKLQRRGQLGTYASGRGQEASIIGSAFALSRDDWIFPAGRESGALLMHGWSIRDLVLYWRGVEDASRMEGSNSFSIAISIGSQLPVAVGVLWGMSLSAAETVGAVYFGDGATSTGAFHEAINFAGVLSVPGVFFCQNNQYAITLPFEKQTNSRSVAQKALAYGIHGIRVDGNDVLAVYEATRRARELALAGEPVLVESVTYRRDSHTTSDDPTRYRTEEEVEEWAEGDPLDRYRSFLEAEGLWDEIDAAAIEEEVEAEFAEGVAAADEYEERAVSELFEHVHDETPADLEEQLAAFEAFLEERPDALDHVEHRPKG